MTCRKVAATHSLLHNRGKDRYRANKLMASKITSLEQHLDYEAIIQTAEIADEDLLYINFENQTLGGAQHILLLLSFLLWRAVEGQWPDLAFCDSIPSNRKHCSKHESKLSNYNALQERVSGQRCMHVSKGISSKVGCMALSYAAWGASPT